MATVKAVLLIFTTQVLMGCYVNVESRKRQWARAPHIVMVLADDLGWNDVSWHNKDMVTPRMEEISREGVRLERSYVYTKCSPSRAALMTGRYPWKLGMQRGAIERYQGTGLNASIKILPEYLKDAGYSTHAVGKWHLGYCNTAYLPTRRGFQSFFGQYNHVTDYYTRKVDYEKYTDAMRGYDLRNNDEVSHEGEGEFSTDLYTRKAVDVIAKHNASQPLFLYVAYQAPHGPVTSPPEKYRSVYNGKDLGRYRSLNMASTITALDAGVGEIYDALKRHGLYDNSVFIFSTDNGGAVEKSSNIPLKGHKEQLYEGGIRGVGFVNSPRLQDTGVDSDQMMFITDWFPTLLNLAGIAEQVPDDVDAYEMWSSISRLKNSPRSRIILNIDQDNREGLWSAAVIDKKHKLIWGQESLLKQKLATQSCNFELYNILEDPLERSNLALGGKMKKKVAELKDLLMKNYFSMLPADYPRDTPAGYPANWGGVLSPGWCEAKY